jgi:hypothetical protein
MRETRAQPRNTPAKGWGGEGTFTGRVTCYADGRCQRCSCHPGLPVEAGAAAVAIRSHPEPLAGRFALHATVRHALEKRTHGDDAAYFEHYVSLLERAPERLELEQTHLFAAMDLANRAGSVGAAVQVERLLSRLENG